MKFTAQGGVGLTVSVSAQGHTVFKVWTPAKASRRPAGTHLRGIRARGRAGRGRGPRPCHLAAARRDDGRHARRRQHAGAGGDIHGRDPPCRGQGRSAAAALPSGRQPCACRGTITLRGALSVREASRARLRYRPGRRSSQALAVLAASPAPGFSSSMRRSARRRRAARGASDRGRNAVAHHAALAF